MDQAPGIATEKSPRVALYPFGSHKPCARSPLPPQSPQPRPTSQRFRSASPGHFSGEPTGVASSSEMGRAQSARLPEAQDCRGTPLPAFQYKANTADMLDMALSWHLCGLDPDVASKTMVLRLSPGKYELDGKPISLWWDAAKQDALVHEDAAGGNSPDVSLASYLKQLSRAKASSMGAVRAKAGDAPVHWAREGRRKDAENPPRGGTAARKGGPAAKAGASGNRPRKPRGDAAYLPLSEFVARVGGVSL